MPKQSPVPDEIDRPFWEACNEEHLVIQYCAACDRFQHPPEAACDQCGRPDRLDWRPVNGVGTIYSYGVIYDTPISSLQPDQPFNCAVVALDDAPGILMISHLPGTPVDQVPVDGKVRLIFEATPANGQRVPEWVVIDK